MNSFDPAGNLILHPAESLRKFGVNPYGENLYRIVFAPTRRHMIYGTWPDGKHEGRMVKRYPQTGNLWIMERWIDAREYCGMTPEQWAERNSILGPYPTFGEYEICHEFFASVPDQTSLDTLVAVLERSRRASFFENRVALQDDYDKEIKDTRVVQDAWIKNKLPAFGTAPMSGYGGGRSQKTAPILRTAEELGLPTSPGLSSRKKKNAPKFQVAIQ